MTDSAIQTEMRRRIRNHMLTSVAGIVGGIVVMGAGSGVVAAIAGTPRPGWANAATVVFGVIGFLMLPGIGFLSTFRNLRCPSDSGSAPRVPGVLRALSTAGQRRPVSLAA